jgi:hypothetical protein
MRLGWAIQSSWKLTRLICGIFTCACLSCTTARTGRYIVLHVQSVQGKCGTVQASSFRDLELAPSKQLYLVPPRCQQLAWSVRGRPHTVGQHK